MLTPARGTKAFTLLELIVVIVILGILAAIAIPSFQKVIVKSKKASIDRTLEAVDRDARALAAFDQAGVAKAHLDDATGEVASSAGTFSVAADGTSVTLTKDNLCRALTIVQGASGTLGDCAAAVAMPAGTTDGFNRADAASLGSTADGKTWVLDSGTMGISANRAVWTSGAPARAVVDLGYADMDVSVKVHGLDNYPSINFRASGAGNYWAIQATPAGGWYFGKVVNGAWTPTQGTSGVVNGSTLRAVAKGDTITVYSDGVLLASVTDPFNNTVTRAGVQTSGAASAFDDFAATPAK